MNGRAALWKAVDTKTGVVIGESNFYLLYKIPSILVTLLNIQNVM